MMDEFIEDDAEEIDNEFEDDSDDEQDDEWEEGELPLARHSALLTKDGMIAMLLLQTFEDSGVIVRLDPREENPVANRYTDVRAAEIFFQRSLRTSRKNGWLVAWEGEPVVG